MIKFNNVDFTYQNAQNGAGVHNITLSIPQGQVVLLCGTIIYPVEVRNGLYDIERGRRKVGRNTS